MIILEEQKAEQKHTDWIPSEIRAMLTATDEIYLAGGAIRKCVSLSDPVSDYDIFFKTEDAVAKASEILDKYGYNCVFVCPLGQLKTYLNGDDKVQLITKSYYPSVQKLLDTFDFTATQGALCGDTLSLGKHFEEDIAAKYLRLHRLSYPAATMNRVIKYQKKGYFVHDCLIDIANRLYAQDPEIIDMSIVYID